jgi:hypothetical protein
MPWQASHCTFPKAGRVVGGVEAPGSPRAVTWQGTHDGVDSLCWSASVFHARECAVVCHWAYSLAWQLTQFDMPT